MSTNYFAIVFITFSYFLLSLISWVHNYYNKVYVSDFRVKDVEQLWQGHKIPMNFDFIV